MDERTVAILDDHELVRSLLPECLPRHGVRCVGSASNAETFIQVLDRAPNRTVALMDLRLDGSATGEQGVDLVRSLRWRMPHVPVVVLTAYATPQVVDECYRLGVSCFLSKGTASAAEVAAAVICADRGERRFPGSADSVAVELRTAAAALARPGAADITAREREVLALVAAGHDNLKISANLGITERTVKAHLSALYRKLRADNRVELALYARELGVRRSGGH